MKGLYIGSCVESLTSKRQIRGTNINLSVSRKGNIELLWDFNTQRDREIEARRPDVVKVNESEKKCKIVDHGILE